MEKLELSEDIVAQMMKRGEFISRDKMKAIKKFNREQLTRYTAEIYKSGFVDGLEAVQKAVEESAKQTKQAEDGVEEVQVEWEDVLNVIKGVKGVTAGMLQDIDAALRREF